jgi:hypothetical protein
MGNSVIKTIKSILNSHFNNEEKTKEYFNNLEKSVRIITELWG